MNPFEKLFKKKEAVKETPSEGETAWDGLAKDVPFNPTNPEAAAQQDDTTRHQNKIIAALTEGDISIIGESNADISHGTRQDFLDEIAGGRVGKEHWDYIISHIVDSGNKRQEYREAIKKLEQEALAPRVSGDLFEVDGKEYKLTPELLEKYGLGPNTQMFQDGKLISLSKMYKVHGHTACTAYVTSAEGTKICSYYRSNSSGSWRFLPDYTVKEGWFGKGYNEESLTLPFEFQEMLTKVSSAEKPLQLDPTIAEFAFYGTAKKVKDMDTYRRIIMNKISRGPHFKEASIEPSYSLSREMDSPLSRQAPEAVGVELMDTPYAPNFQEEISSFEMETDLYGKVMVKCYPSANGKLRYTICEINNKGERQAWVSSVESTKKITSVGTPTEWVSGGLLTTPLYEYSSQNGGYGDPSDTKGSYENMWKNYLSKIPLLKKYIQDTTPK